MNESRKPTLQKKNGKYFTSIDPKCGIEFRASMNLNYGADEIREAMQKDRASVGEIQNTLRIWTITMEYTLDTIGEVQLREAPDSQIMDTFMRLFFSSDSPCFEDGLNPRWSPYLAMGSMMTVTRFRQHWKTVMMLRDTHVSVTGIAHDLERMKN